MKVSALASGSSGNCFYIENGNSAVLIDAGISNSQIIKRAESLELDMGKIKGIFITHEHIDHVRGADVLARKLRIPIFSTKKTAANCFLCSDESFLKYIKNYSVVKIGSMSISAFSKSHNAADPVSFSIKGNKVVSVITDAGYGCKNISEHVSKADFLFMEANHDENMLSIGPYPYYLKRLIGSNIGHMSNRQAGLCVLENASHKLKRIVLSHLSEVNNTPQVAFNTFVSLISERSNFSPKIDISLGDKPTELMNV